MALTAKFLSDFSAFYTDVNKATGMLGGFQDEANKAAGALDKMPASMNQIQGSTQGVITATANWGSMLTGAASALGLAFSVNTLKNFAIGVIDTAATIGDMSDKLGISASAVQRFGYAADQSGSSLTTVDSAIKKMNDNLAGGSKSTVAALSAAGLEFDTIRRMAPEQAFVAIGDAVAGIEDPMLRAQVATDLFGKAGQELIPTFLAGIRKVGDETTVMSDDTVARLKAAQDSWGSFSNAVTVYSGEAISWIGQMGQKWQSTSQLIAQAANPFVAVPQAIKDLDLTASAAIQSASNLGAMVATVTPPVQNFADRALKPVALNAEQAAAEIAVMNSKLVTVPAVSSAAKKEADALAASLDRVRLTHYNMGNVAVAASQNVQGFGVRMSEVVAINRDFSAELTASTIQTDHFGHVIQTNVQPSLQGMGQGIINTTAETVTFRDNLGLLAQSFANLGQIGGAELSKITKGLGTMTGAANLALGAVDSIKNGLKGGFSLSGLASITSGIGGIVSAASAAIGAIKSLWSAAKGGEEGQVVNPARSAWFRGRTVQDIGDQLAPFMSGEEARLLIEKVFKAKTQSDFSKASSEIDRILRGNSYASGTGGFKDFGSGTVAMLHGKEAVIPASAVASGGGLGGAVVINIHAQGAFFDTPGDLQRLADKVNDALTAKYGLTNRNRAA